MNEYESKTVTRLSTGRRIFVSVIFGLMRGNQEKASNQQRFCVANIYLLKKQRAKRMTAPFSSIYYRTYNKMQTYHVLSVVAVLAIPKT